MSKFRFGDFELNLDAFELKALGGPVKLERRALDLLTLLVKHRDRLVSREEIIAALWPPNVVIDFDSGLNTLVRKVRGALGDSSDNPRYIETVPGRGYRFIAPVVAVAAAVATPALVAVPVPAHAKAAAPPARATRRTLIAVVVSLFVVAAGFAAWLTNRQHSPTRIAVLPFENLTGSDELAYLAAGLAEDTSISLAQIDASDLRVIGVSARGLADSSLPIVELGRKLGVDFVVQSSLRLDRDLIRVSSRLMRVADNEQIWSASIDRQLTNVLGLQRELSTAIAEQVRLKLSPSVAAAIERRQTQNPAAYALYLKGRYEWARLTPAGIRRALEYFERATESDPDYGLAWAGLAFGAITSTRTADVAPKVAVPIAVDALKKALELAPDLAETQMAQGYFSLFHDLDFPASVAASRRAIELDPNNAQAHILLGVSLFQDGQLVEGREMLRRARELEPMNALAFANSANLAVRSGDPPAAIEFGKQAVAIDPEFWVGYLWLGAAQRALGQLDEALQSFNDAARFSGGHSLTYSGRVDVLVQLGRMDEARALLAEVKKRADLQYAPPFMFAVIHARLGERDAAFTWLERAVEERDVNLLAFPKDKRLESLRGDPRFADLVRRCNCGAEPPPKN